MVKKNIENIDLETTEEPRRGMFVELGNVAGKNTPDSVCPNCKGNRLVLVSRIVEMEDTSKMGTVTQQCMCPSCRAIATETLKLEDFKGHELKSLQRLIKYQPRPKQETLYEKVMGDLG